MSTTPPTWSDAINALLNGAAAVVYQIGNVISSNAQLIATVIVLGGIAYATVSVARRVLPSVMGFFRGLF